MPEFDIRGEYRYTLTRLWDPALPTITFVLLNPIGHCGGASVSRSARGMEAW
jgi:hypothetical protein